jgi:glyoxylase-like metal-dependent hydrolase (beta-lactamase superfamily II)
VPTFPNATYYFAEAERDHWRREVDGRGLPPELAYNAGVYADSVQPVLDAGLVHTVVEAAEIASGVVVEPGPGHTPGHVLVTVDVDGTHVIFAGDVMHNPVQVAHPHLSTMGCFSGSQAETTRREVLARCADDGFLLAAAHFRAPHMFRIERSGDTFRLGTA